MSDKNPEVLDIEMNIDGIAIEVHIERKQLELFAKLALYPELAKAHYIAGELVPFIQSALFHAAKR